jgi:hypothetical protein
VADDGHRYDPAHNGRRPGRLLLRGCLRRRPRRYAVHGRRLVRGVSRNTERRQGLLRRAAPLHGRRRQHLREELRNDKTTGPLANGLCTPTEAAFVQHDIDKKVATAPGNDPASSCYACLYNNGCIDDTHFNDFNLECGDPTITTGTAAQCLAIVDCILGSSCAAQGLGGKFTDLTRAGGIADQIFNCAAIDNCTACLQ